MLTGGWFVADLNPAAQGSSLTEGKRAKRSKKQNDSVNGDGRSSPNGDEDEFGHSEKKRNEVSAAIGPRPCERCESDGDW